MPDSNHPLLEPVTRRAEAFWRSGSYDFSDRPTYSMTPAENRLAVEQFSEVPLVCTHVGSPLDGKLGTVKGLFGANADFSTLGLNAHIPKWLDTLYRDDSGKALPLPLSANWDRATKTLKNVALVLNPRIEGAALFGGPSINHGTLTSACFAAEQGAMTLADPLTPNEPATGPDPATESTLEVEGDEEALQTLKALAERMGLVCEMAMPEPATPSVTPPVSPMPVPAPGGDIPMSNATSPRKPSPVAAPRRDPEIDRQLAELRREQEAMKKALASKDRADREAHFSQQKQSAKARGETFVRQLVRDGKIVPAQAGAIFEAHQQAALDDLTSPAEVHFSKDGKKVKGSRLDAFEAGWASAPDLGLNRETIPDREVPFEQLLSPTGPTQKPTQARTDSLLKHSAIGQQILRERNGHKN